MQSDLGSVWSVWKSMQLFKVTPPPFFGYKDVLKKHLIIWNDLKRFELKALNMKRRDTQFYFLIVCHVYTM
jgi:hypothetical protein